MIGSGLVPFSIAFSRTSDVVNDVLKTSILEPGDASNRHGVHHSPNELHITGDLLASGEDSLRFAPDFSLEDPEISLRCPRKEKTTEDLEVKREPDDSVKSLALGQLCQKVLPLHPQNSQTGGANTVNSFS